jgi:uncharacterized protein (DUF1810 family)
MAVSLQRSGRMHVTDKISQTKSGMDDPFDLHRFVVAQDPEFESVLGELRRGRKTGHWMWFIFPQVRGLGSSSMASHFGISSLAEASAYLEHPILGARLVQCTELINDLPSQPIEQVLGGIDAMKFRSSITLFAQAGRQSDVFARALKKYFAGEPDQRTLDRLAQRQRRADA